MNIIATKRQARLLNYPHPKLSQSRRRQWSIVYLKIHLCDLCVALCSRSVEIVAEQSRRWTNNDCLINFAFIRHLCGRWSTKEILIRFQCVPLGRGMEWKRNSITNQMISRVSLFSERTAHFSIMIMNNSHLYCSLNCFTLLYFQPFFLKHHISVACRSAFSCAKTETN